MRFERLVVAERDLDTGDLRILIDQLADSRAVDFVACAMRAKQNDAITGAPVFVFEAPDTFAVQRDNGFDPACAIEIGPLIGKPQMAFDDLAADRLEIDHAGIASEVLAKPSTAVGVDLRPRLAMNRPVVEHAVLERCA